jgi:adenylate kinase
MQKYVIIGVQGSGKGTQGAMLAREFDLTQIAVGDIFRWHVQNHTKLGAQVRRTMAEGRLVDDDMVEAVVRQRLVDHDWNYGFVVDGFPRNARQAEFFLESYDIDGVIYLTCPTRRCADGFWPGGCVRTAGWTTPHRTTPKVRNRCDAVVILSAGRTTPKRWRTGCATITEDDPVLELFRARIRRNGDAADKATVQRTSVSSRVGGRQLSSVTPLSEWLTSTWNPTFHFELPIHVASRACLGRRGL